MSMNSSASGSRWGNAARHPTRTIVSRGAAAVSIAAIVVIAAWLLINGRVLQAAAAHETADQINKENVLFCQKFGMPRGTGDFAKCAGYLDEIRNRQTERLNSDSIL
jgi:hypothetical protein